MKVFGKNKARGKNKSTLIVLISVLCVFSTSGAFARWHIHFGSSSSCSYINNSGVNPPTQQCADIYEGVTPWKVEPGPNGLGCSCFRWGSCPLGYLDAGATCKAYCPAGITWDPILKECQSKGSEKNCTTRSDNPIDFIEGVKTRAERVFDVSEANKIPLTFYYSNLANNERTLGRDNYKDIGLVVRSTVSGFSSYDSFLAAHLKNGIDKASSIVENQYFGAVDQYWKHSFNESLEIRGGIYFYHSKQGDKIRFSSIGRSDAYSSLLLEIIEPTEDLATEYKLTNFSVNEVKIFDATGKLTKVERLNNDVLILSYDTSNRLSRVTSSKGGYLEFSYQSLPTNSNYNVEPTMHDYVVAITTSRGENAILNWEHSFIGRTATFHMLTQLITHVGSAAEGARAYEYNDSRWPASITDIYDVTNIQNNTRKLYAHFDYDDHGRAIVSELAGGFERVAVNYVNDDQRIVTNALGKNAIYNFADFNGVVRLVSVKGEATSSCAESNASYTYYPEGNLETKTKNGVVTHYNYNSRNQKTVTTKAQGKAQEFISQTCWHPIHNKPERVIEPGRVTIYDYFEGGQLKDKTVEPRTADNDHCP